MSQTPSLSAVLQAAGERMLNEVHTCMLGEIVSYDSAEGSASVQPLIKRIFTQDGERIVETLPVIQRVPVKFLGSGGIRVKFPISVGDVVLLLFCENSIDRWKVRGGQLDPGDERKFSMSDAVAIPGFSDFTSFMDADPMIEITSTEVKIGGTDRLVRKTEFESHTHTVTGSAGGDAIVGGLALSPAAITGTSKLRG